MVVDNTLACAPPTFADILHSCWESLVPSLGPGTLGTLCSVNRSMRQVIHSHIQRISAQPSRPGSGHVYLPAYLCSECPNLTHLSFACTQSLQSLSLVPFSLKSLDISNTAVSDLSQLLCCPNLEYLDASQSFTKSAMCDSLLGNANIEPIPLSLDIPLLPLLSSATSRHACLCDLQPLAHCTALTSLNISGQAVSDLSPLTSCFLLRFLDVSNTKVDDIYDLCECASLTHLCAASTRIDVLPPMSDFPALQSLDVSATRITNIPPLPPTMTRIKLTRTAVRDLSPLTACTALTDLDLAGTYVVNLAVLRACTTLRALVLGRSGLQLDLSPLSSCTGLRSLVLEHFGSLDSVPPSMCNSLQHLRLRSGHIRDLAPLTRFTALQCLGLYDSPASDLMALNSCSSLTCLDLCNTAPPSHTWQPHWPDRWCRCTALAALSLKAKPVSDTMLLYGCTTLRVLDLSSTRVSDITPVSCCTALVHLDLARTPVRDVSPLNTCTALEYLDLFKTHVADIWPLSACASLMYLNLTGTKVSDMSPLRACPFLPPAHPGQVVCRPGYSGPYMQVPVDPGLMPVGPGASSCGLEQDGNHAWLLTHHCNDWTCRLEQCAPHAHGAGQTFSM